MVCVASYHVFCIPKLPPLSHLFPGYGSGAILVLEVAMKKKISKKKGHSDRVSVIAFDGSGRYIASGRS
jgi:hypothetical protein